MKRSAICESNISFFQNKLLEWYNENGRYFPWREKSASNYELIITEVFLQRTKAEAVATFLPKFIDKYPNWESLGKANEYEIQESLNENVNII